MYMLVYVQMQGVASGPRASGGRTSVTCVDYC